MDLRSILRKLAPPIVDDCYQFFKRRFKKYYGLDEIDRKLEKYLNYENGFYVELGANDGKTFSNTLHFELSKKWQGVLIEPALHKYYECRKNRSQRNAIYCAACVSFDYPHKFVEIAYSNMMSTPFGLESDISDPMDHARDGSRFLESGEDVVIFGAKAETLNDLLVRSNAPKVIDLLSLDVEGAEIEVLKGVNHDEYRFRYMLVECRDFTKLDDFLSRRRYTFAEKLSEHDYLFSSVTDRA